MRKLCLLCTLLLGTGLVLAQSNETAISYGDPAKGPAVSATVNNPAAEGFLGDGDVLGVPAYAVGQSTRSGENCPAGSLCGQDSGACGSTQWYFYDDLQFCNPDTPTQCQRVRCENFPPPSVTINKAIGVITWRGLYVDDDVNGCTKPTHTFRVRFYNQSPTDPNGPDPNTPYYSEVLTASAADTGDTVLFSGSTIPAIVWQFSVVLTTPVNLTSGWFAVTGDGTPGCYHLWEGSAQGDNSFWQWWENAVASTKLHNTTLCDLNYCFGEKKVGACCQDCIPFCEGPVSDIYCGAIGGRFHQDTACSAISPACGQGMGACCCDDGSCLLKTCGECLPPTGCVGDLNCDGTINFGDINPFVLYLSNIAAWQGAFPGCPIENGDINCDGVMGQGSFGDINPFVALMTQCGSGCACPGPINCGGPRAQGCYWAGPNTTCPTSCCTVVVPAGALLEDEPDDCAPDTFNGGCNITPPLFSPIAIGQTIYGESGTFGGGTRDMDWYRVTVGTPQIFTVTVEAEFDVQILAFRQGPNGPNDPCTDYHDAAAPVAPLQGTHNKCTPVQLVTRCLPAGTYIFVVSPATFSGVLCYADYKVTLAAQSCDPCTIAACPGGAYVEGTLDPDDPPPAYCMTDPTDPTVDPENGGCNETPEVFEPLPQTPGAFPDTFTVCGKLFARDGYRDLDWWSLNLPLRSQVQWTVLSEVPCRATIAFWDSGGGVYTPPTCAGGYYYWVDTLCDPCAQKVWNGTMFYEPGQYWFLVFPEDAAGAVWYGYPCPMGSADLGNDYQFTMTVVGIQCENEILAKPNLVDEQAGDPPCPPAGYDDTYNSGCDHTPTGPALNLGFDSANAWISRSGTWLTDPNDPNTLTKDYDWYQFSVPASRRFKVYLYSDFPATWEIWKQNDCAYGPIEGLAVPPCHDAGVFTVRCYTIGTYWLRVFPTTRADCGKYYYLALTESGACSVCNLACTGTNLDDPCDDVTDYDTNYGCDYDPNDPNHPPAFMTFNCAVTYCGRVYAKIYPNGSGYYDPDWFQLTQTNATARRIRLAVAAEFLAHIEVYLSCADYNSGNVIPGLDSITPLLVGTACPAVTVTSTGSFAQNSVVYGRITAVDQFGNLLTNYYPCAKAPTGAGWRWRIAVTCIV